MKNNLPLRSLLPVVLWFIFMCVLFFIPGGDLPGGGFFEKHHIDKLAHFVLFFMLVVFFCVPILKSSLPAQRKLQLMVGFAVLAVWFGIMTEFIQGRYIPKRAFDLWDWLADTFGVVVALIVMVRLKNAYPQE